MSFLRTLNYYFSLRKNLKKSRNEILHLRERKFRKIIKYAYKNIPFYNEYYTSHGIKEKDLNSIPISELPIINKNILMNNFEKFFIDKRITKNKVAEFLKENPDPSTLLFNRYYVIHSSGSSGKIGFYLYSKREWDFIKAISTRMFPKFNLERKKYAFIGAVDGHYAAISLFLSPLHQFEQYFYKDFMVMDINRPIKTYIEKLNVFNPDNLTGYPYGIKLLAKFQREKILNIYPKVIVCGGEQLLKSDRVFIKDIWKKAEIVDNYATSESLAMGVDREDLEGMYIYDDAVYLEIEDNRTLLTNLYNYTQPLIRYELTDVIKPTKKEKYKWPFTCIENISGRVELIPTFINQDGEKDFIHPIVIAEIFVKGVDKFQFVQTSDQSFEFKISILKSESVNRIIDDTKKILNSILERKNMRNINYKIIVMDDIKPDKKTGKFQLIISYNKK